MQTPAVAVHAVIRLICAACVLAIASEALAQRLPVRCYGEAEGLVQSSVTVAFQDRRGFLWIGTNDGLSRFDGYQFINYDTAHGLVHGFVTAIAEDARGRIWAGTMGAILRLDEAPLGPTITRDGDAAAPSPGLWREYALPGAGADGTIIGGIARDRAGTLWLATSDGVYRGRLDNNGEPHFARVPGLEGRASEAFADRRGRVWLRLEGRGFLAVDGDLMVSPDGSPELATQIREPMGIDEDRDGTLRVTLGTRLLELDASVLSGTWRPVPIEPPAHALQSVRSDSSGRLWLGTPAGLLLRENGAWRVVSTAQGLAAGRLTPLIEDRDGNLWVAAQSALCRISPAPVVSYTAADGLPHPIVLGVFEGIDGRIYVNTPGGFGRVDGDRVSLVPGSDMLPYRALERRVVRSRAGDWWVLLDDALVRFGGPALDFRRPAQRIAAGGPGVRFANPGTNRTSGVYEDPAGRLLVATVDGRLHWVDRSGAVAPVLPDRASRPDGTVLMPGPADAAGNIWLSSMEALARLRHDGIERLESTSGLPGTNVRSLHVDREGRLWIGLRAGGVSMVRDPAADRLEFVNYSTRNGLASDAVWSIADDDAGRVYLATSRGLDRLDPATGRIRRYTTVDGLPSNYATYCLRDTKGHIWVGTINGLARIDPAAERPEPAPPPVHVTRLQAAGEDVPVSGRAGSHDASLALPWSRNHLLIEYAAVSPGRERAFRYQYRLGGLSPEWSAPTDQRAITFAQLPAGRFRFEVRAIDWDGVTSPEPAVVALQILPPLWRRWWFVTLAVALVSSAALSLHRLRLRHAVAMERVRRQVATDLHDDLGAGLAQVAILSEVAKRQDPADHLDTIAALARGMRASMDDIVWAIDPRTDRLTELTQRIRQVAGNALAADGTALDLRLPADRDLQRIGLAPDKRRHVLLVAKEAITNVARHAAASRVEISLELERRHLRLLVRDNGRGFAPGALREGQGLRSLERRAAELCAHIRIESAPGRGTVVDLRVPLA